MTRFHVFNVSVLEKLKEKVESEASRKRKLRSKFLKMSKSVETDNQKGWFALPKQGVLPTLLCNIFIPEMAIVWCSAKASMFISALAFCAISSCTWTKVTQHWIWRMDPDNTLHTRSSFSLSGAKYTTFAAKLSEDESLEAQESKWY